jgi:hypothetical protein
MTDTAQSGVDEPCILIAGEVTTTLNFIEWRQIEKPHNIKSFAAGQAQIALITG